MKTKLHFSRFEFKYVLPQALRAALEKEFQYFVELDSYVAQKPGAKYFVRSLYFDTPTYDCYFEKVDGMKTRSKFRLRTYTDDQDEVCPVFLEVKGRHNNLVFKHRAGLVEKKPDSRSRGGPDSLDPTSAKVIGRLDDGPLKNQFIFESFRKRLRPVVLIDYWRRPYVSKYDPEFRLTFDDTLSGTVTESLFPGPDSSRRLLLPGYTILEVKFRFHMPQWFHRLIESMELTRVSISKFCRGMEGLEIASEEFNREIRGRFLPRNW